MFKMDLIRDDRSGLYNCYWIVASKATANTQGGGSWVIRPKENGILAR